MSIRSFGAFLHADLYIHACKDLYLCTFLSCFLLELRYSLAVENLLSPSCLDPDFNVLTMARRIVYHLNKCQILRHTALVGKIMAMPTTVQDTLLAIQAAYHE